jgi:hypothetical protein
MINGNAGLNQARRFNLPSGTHAQAFGPRSLVESSADWNNHAHQMRHRHCGRRLVGTLSVGTEAWARGGGGRGKAHGISWGGKGISRTPARVAAFQNRVALLKLARPTTTASTPRMATSTAIPGMTAALAYARPASPSLLTKTGGASAVCCCGNRRASPAFRALSAVNPLVPVLPRATARCPSRQDVACAAC